MNTAIYIQVALRAAEGSGVHRGSESSGVERESVDLQLQYFVTPSIKFKRLTINARFASRLYFTKLYDLSD